MASRKGAIDYEEMFSHDNIKCNVNPDEVY
jgi:hypothetical protein